MEKTEESLKEEEYLYLVLSCSSLCQRRKSDSGGPGNPVALWLHKAISASGLHTVYWPAAPQETSGNAGVKH